MTESQSTEQQSDAIIETFNDTHNNVATKDDIDRVEQNMSEKIDRAEQTMGARIDGLDKRITMLQWMMGIFSGSIIALLVILVSRVSGV